MYIVHARKNLKKKIFLKNSGQHFKTKIDHGKNICMDAANFAALAAIYFLKIGQFFAEKTLFKSVFKNKNKKSV